MAEKDVAVALSGSGFRLAVHAGALQGILDKGYTITEIAGTSGGSIIAALYATGFSPYQMYNLMFNTDFSQFLNWDLTTIVERKALSDGSELLEWLETQLGSKNTFVDALIPLTVIATDLNKYKAKVFNKTLTPDFLIAQACRASCSIPVVYEPVINGSEFLVDGGICDDLPINYVDPTTFKIAVEIFNPSVPLDKNYNILSVLAKVLDTILEVENDHQLEMVPDCIPIKITTPPGAELDAGLTAAQKEQLYTLGYEATTTILSTL